ncbi:hypothetical protein ACWGIV_22740 [Streptomyces sp. NPDC054844]
MRGALARAVASARGTDTVLHVGPGHAAHLPARADREGAHLTARLGRAASGDTTLRFPDHLRRPPVANEPPHPRAS